MKIKRGHNKVYSAYPAGYAPYTKRWLQYEMKILLNLFLIFLGSNPILAQSIEIESDTICEAAKVYPDGSKSIGCFFKRNDSTIRIGKWEYLDSNNTTLLIRIFENGTLISDETFGKKGRIKKKRIYGDTVIVENFKNNGKIRTKEFHSDFESGYSSKVTVLGFRNSGTISSKSLFINKEREYFSRIRINGSIEREIYFNDSHDIEITKVYNKKGKCKYQNELTKRTLENGNTVWVDEDITVRDQWNSFGSIILVAGFTPLIGLLL